MPAPENPTVNVDHADNVGPITEGGGSHLPYAWIIAAVSFAIIGGFAVVTWIVLDAVKGSGIDAATKGSIIQTWNNLVIMAAGFWVGSSLAGKMGKK